MVWQPCCQEETWEAGWEPEGPSHRGQERRGPRSNGFGKVAPSGMAAISHRRLLSTCNVASASEELDFSFYLNLNSSIRLIATKLDTVVVEEEIIWGRSLGLSSLVLCVRGWTLKLHSSVKMRHAVSELTIGK